MLGVVLQRVVGPLGCKAFARQVYQRDWSTAAGRGDQIVLQVGGRPPGGDRVVRQDRCLQARCPHLGLEYRPVGCGRQCLCRRQRRDVNRGSVHVVQVYSDRVEGSPAQGRHIVADRPQPARFRGDEARWCLKVRNRRAHRRERFPVAWIGDLHRSVIDRDRRGALGRQKSAPVQWIVRGRNPIGVVLDADVGRGDSRVCIRIQRLSPVSGEGGVVEARIGRRGERAGLQLPGAPPSAVGLERRWRTRRGHEEQGGAPDSFGRRCNDLSGSPDTLRRAWFVAIAQTKRVQTRVLEQEIVERLSVGVRDDRTFRIHNGRTESGECLVAHGGVDKHVWRRALRPLGGLYRCREGRFGRAPQWRTDTGDTVRSQGASGCATGQAHARRRRDPRAHGDSTFVVGLNAGGAVKVAAFGAVLAEIAADTA